MPKPLIAIKACVLLCTAGVSSAADTSVLTPDGPWTVRYAQMRDQRPEWTAKCYLPDYKIGWADRERPEVRFDDQPDGRCRGYAIVGRPFRVPRTLAREVRVAFDYQTYCAADKPSFKRAGMANMLLLTPEQWRAFASAPRDARKLLTWSAKNMALYAAPVHRSQDDVTDWSRFTSGDLRAYLRARAGKTVVLALAWGAAHFNLVERGAFRNVEFLVRTQEEITADFFASLDLARPELHAVKAALDAKDMPAAKRALVEHMKTRKTPPPLPLHPKTDKRSVARADEYCDHVFRFVGCPPYKLGKTIRWNEDPFDYDQWAIALNRHYHWAALGRVYAGTKDETYAREFVSQLESWIAAMPVRIGRHYIQGVSPESTLSLDAGIRMGRTWFPTFSHFLHSPSFTVDAHVAMLMSFRDHAVYLMDPRHFRPGSNWGMMELNGLYHLGVMLPEFKDADTWRRTAEKRLVGELDGQFYPDGAQTELTPGYHGVSVGNATWLLEIAKHTGQKLPPEVLAKLERTFDYYQRIMMPDTRTPALNDSGWGGVQGWLERGLTYFPKRDDWRYGATRGKKGRQPAYTSCKLDYAGWYVMRTGWAPTDKYLLLDAGPFGAGHQHEDKLHVILYAHGRRLVTDPGNYSYDASDWRKYVLRARAHNTVLVDGMEQHRRRQTHTRLSTKPQTNRWVTNDRFDYAEGAYSDGFGPKCDKTVTHTRRVLFVKPHYWILVDEFRPADTKPHTYEALFHMDAPDAKVDPGTHAVVSTHPKGGNVAIVPLSTDGLRATVVKGQKAPVLLGWLPTGKHNKLRPIPTAVFRRQAAGRTLMAYALVPFERRDQLPRVESVKVSGKRPNLGAKLTFPDGRTQTVLTTPHTDQAMTVGDVTVTTELALIQDGRTVFVLEPGK